MRLQKHLAECGVDSRRACEALIAAGRVAVNGVVAELGGTVDPEQDEVTLDGHPVTRNEKVYVVLNKPAGYVTTAQDEFGRKNVLDCVKGVKARVFPVGRLDMDVEGVLLLTNDGELAHRLLHPRYGVEKVYYASVRGCVSPASVRKLEAGVLLEDGLSAPAKASVIATEGNSTRLRLTLREGRKREVKRMCEAVGHPVKRLKRVMFGPLTADGLRPGEWRYLSDKEIGALRAGRD
jgi:pseudouridine synthase